MFLPKSFLDLVQVPTLVNWGIVDGGVGDREYWDLVYWFLTQAGKE